jgi:hypothetical protein
MQKMQYDIIDSKQIWALRCAQPQEAGIAGEMRLKTATPSVFVQQDIAMSDPVQALARQARLAQTLRENMKKRREQARKRNTNAEVMSSEQDVSSEQDLATLLPENDAIKPPMETES